MYRIFCESYKNYIKSFDEENYRLKVAEPFSLIVNIKKFEKEKELESTIYKKLCDLLSFIKENEKDFPKLKAFLWTIESRGMISKKYNIAEKQELEEQAKLINSFLKLAYWY